MSNDKDVVLISSRELPIGNILMGYAKRSNLFHTKPDVVPISKLSPEVNCGIRFKTRLVREALTKNQKRKMSARRIKKEQAKVMPSYSTGKLRS